MKGIVLILAIFMAFALFQANGQSRDFTHSYFLSDWFNEGKDEALLNIDQNEEASPPLVEKTPEKGENHENEAPQWPEEEEESPQKEAPPPPKPDDEEAEDEEEHEDLDDHEEDEDDDDVEETQALQREPKIRRQGSFQGCKGPW